MCLCAAPTTLLYHSSCLLYNCSPYRNHTHLKNALCVRALSETIKAALKWNARGQGETETINLIICEKEGWHKGGKELAFISHGAAVNPLLGHWGVLMPLRKRLGSSGPSRRCFSRPLKTSAGSDGSLLRAGNPLHIDAIKAQLQRGNWDCGVCSLASDKVVSLIADFMSVCPCWTEAITTGSGVTQSHFLSSSINRTQRSKNHLNVPFLDL